MVTDRGRGNGGRGGGKGGGGRGDFAQAGGTLPDKIKESFESIKKLIN